jgi:signal transduction histidine kinase
MSVFASLRNRIFLTSALLTVLSIGVAVYIVNARVTRQIEQQLQHEIVATGALVDEIRSTRAQNFTMMARLIADAPTLKAAVDTKDPPTVQGVLSSYQTQLNSNLLLVTNNSGAVLATVGASPRIAAVVANQPSIREAIRGRESFTLLPQPDGMLQLVTVPIAVGITHPDVLGTLSVGFLFDDALAAQLKEITGSEIAFGMDGQILATTLPPSDRQKLALLLRQTDRTGTVALGTGEYVALPLALSPGRDLANAGAGPVALILRSRTEQLRFLTSIRRELVGTGIGAVLLATLLSFAVARTITQPLAATTRVMRDVAATGDLTRKIVLRGGKRWDDEDAQLLATTFNTLTESIARFQREISQKERLSSLGRLSTVIAHEVRNPLMIIKASLHALRQPGLSDAALREAVLDIDEEIARLNGIVNEVLDFARPIQFEIARADLNAVCRESASAASAAPGPLVTVDLDPSMPKISTDAERLRIALVNLIVNARQAVEQPTGAAAVGAPPVRHASPGEAPADGRRIVLATRAAGDRASIFITDNGPGIDRADLPRVFDPYFTTKRGGTGLGLPIAKNIVEGLGGTLTIETVPGRGTEVRISLPFDSAQGKPFDAAQGKPVDSAQGKPVDSAQGRSSESGAPDARRRADAGSGAPLS